MPDIAAVIGNHEGERVLGDCLASLQAQTLRPTEVIVVDAASTDGSAEIASRYGAQFLRRENLGLGYLYNEGARAAGAELVLLANNDVAFDDRCLELLAAELDADPERFAADPAQLDWDGSEVIHARTTLTRGRLLREHLPGLHLDDRVPSDAVAPTVSAHGAAMLVRRSMFERLGGFDETFFMEWEDLDLCWRAWLSGWKSVHVPSARLRHRVGGATTRAVLPRRAASSHHNIVRFALKCLPLRPAATVVAGELLRLGRHPRSVATGLAQAARELPSILTARRRLRPHADVYRRLVGRR